MPIDIKPEITPEPTPVPAPGAPEPTPIVDPVPSAPEPTPDPVAQIKALEAQVQAMLAERAAEKEAAAAKDEEARKATLTESERLAEDRKAIEQEKAQLVKEARDAAMDRLKINPKARALVPADADPRTAEGKATLERWAKENPEFLTPDVAAPAIPQAPEGSMLSKIINGIVRHPYMTAEHARDMLSK